MSFDPLSAALDIGGKIIDRVWPNPEDKAKAQLALLQLQQQGELAEITGQLEIDKVEAGSTNTFVAGWRPFIGWVCGCGLAEDVIVRPLLAQISTLFRHPIVLQPLDTSTLLPLLLGILGLGGMRTYEKLNGVASGH